MKTLKLNENSEAGNQLLWAARWIRNYAPRKRGTMVIIVTSNGLDGSSVKTEFRVSNQGDCEIFDYPNVVCSTHKQVTKLPHKS